MLLVTLFFLAITQPLLTLLSHQAEFFIARLSEPEDIYTLVGVLAVSPLLLAGLVAGLRRLSSPLGLALHSGLCAVMFALVVLLALHPLLAGAWSIGVAAVAGCAAVAIYRGNEDLQSMIAWSGPLMLLWLLWVLFSFLGLSPVHRILARDINRRVMYRGIKSSAPVVFLIFDETPLASLLNASGAIDAELFPNFARLASQSTWYRRTSTVADLTEQAVPAIVSGSRPSLSKLAMCADYPDNLFTLFGGNYQLVTMESGTRLVPPGQQRNLLETYPERMRAMATDLWLVYEHLVVPRNLEGRLTDVSHQWREFGVATDRRSFTSRPRTFHRFEEHITASDDRVLYYHHCDLPHYPYEYLPDGAAYDTSAEVVAEGLVPVVGNERDAWSTDWAALQAYQRHLLQLVLCDRLLGDLLDRLQRVGLYDKSLLVVTSDHGACFRGHLSHRRIGADNFMDIGAVPLFIKAPHQTKGEVYEGRVETIDILPSITAMLGQKLPWPVDGRAVLATPPSASQPMAILGHGDGQVHGFTWDDAKLAAIVRYKEQNFGAHGGPERLFHLGPDAALQGQAPHPAAPAPGALTLDWEPLLSQVDPHAPFLPNRIRGSVSGVPAGTQVALAVALNGTVRGTTLAVGNAAGSADFSSLLDPHWLVSGANHVDVYRVDADGSTLHQVAATTHETYALADGAVTSSEGKSWRLDSSLRGGVDQLVALEGSVLVQGWAGQPERGPAERILFFSGQRFLLAGTTGWEIDWRGKSLGPGLATAGFSYSIPQPILAGASPESVRVFALRGNAATEIPTTAASHALPREGH